MTDTILLVVEDEALILQLLEDALSDAGYTVIAAGNGAEAVAALHRRGGELAGLITDIRIGGGATGWDVARQARERDPGLPVVYVTADSGSDWTNEGVPGSQVVEKPFSVAQIVDAVAKLIGSSSRAGVGAATDARAAS